MNRTKTSTNTPWEEVIGYSRAVRVGNLIEITGTVAFDNGKVVGKGDPYLQTKCILNKIEEQLKKLQAGLEDVIRTRIYLVDINDWQEVGKVHGEVFRHIRPATTMLAVKALISPEYLVEIEATAIVDN